MDAPCTALGGEKNAYKRYRVEMSRKLSAVQKVMLLNAFDSLKDGGELVYSTCTFVKEENEEVVQFLLDKREEARLMEIKLPIPHKKGMDGLTACWRIYPQQFESDGFFIAKLKRVI